MNFRQIFLSGVVLMGAGALDAFSSTGVVNPEVRPHRLAPAAAIAMCLENSCDIYDEEELISLYLTIDPVAFDCEAIRGLGGNVTLEAGTVVTVRVPRKSLRQLVDVVGVEYVQPASKACQMLDMARPEAGVDLIHEGAGLSHGYTGKDVIVGIVDSGFDYGHAAFHDEYGNLRIKRVWEQGTTPEGQMKSPLKFGYGTEFVSEEEINGAGGDIRNNSHGTHVAAIAAGSDMADGGRLLGMAPDADIVLVSLNGSTDANVDISNAIAYIFDYADSEGKPCVINLSLGAHEGPHDGTSHFDRIADSLQGPGRLIVGSAGNHRLNKFHAERVFESADEAPMRTFIDFLKPVTTANAGGNIEVWGDEGQEMEVSILCYNVNTGTIADRFVIFPQEFPTDQPDAVKIDLGRNVSGDMTVASELNPANNKQHVMMTSGITSIRTNHAVAIEVKPLTPGKVDIWADNVKLGLISRNVEGFSDGTAPTIAEIGGTARRILTVGAYTTRAKYNIFNETEELTLDETVGDICSFSANGPTADGRVKPDITAPGCYISSAVSSNDASGTLQISYAYELPERNMMYGYMQGTSMASPLVAGIVATWLQAYPAMTPEKLAGIIGKTARKDDFTGKLATPDNDWGYGKINAYEGIKECLAASYADGVPSLPATRQSVNVWGDNLHIVFNEGCKEASVEILNTQGQLVMTDAWINITPGLEVSTSLASLSKGVYIMVITTPNARNVVKIDL